MAGAVLEDLEDNPRARALCVFLIDALDEIGPYRIEIRETSLGLHHGGPFLDIRPRAEGLLLTIVTRRRLIGSRVRASRRAPRNRWRNAIPINSEQDLDRELRGWLDLAYSSSAD